MEVPIYYDRISKKLTIGVKDDSGYSLRVVESNDSSSSLAVDQLQLENVTVVDSSKSGTGRENRDIYTPIIKPLLDRFNVKHEYILTSSADTISNFSGSLKAGNHTIILISGDTSVNEFVNGLPDGKGTITLVVIPLGTGNSLSLSIGNDNELSAVKNLIHGKVVPLNLYNVQLPSDTWLIHEGTKVKLLPSQMTFVVVLSWGFHASLVADSDTLELRKHGIDRFKIAAMNNLNQQQEYPGTTLIAGKQVKGPYAYWLLTPSQKFEPTFEISPKGNIFEDSLYFVSFKTEEKEGYIMDIMTQVYNCGEHVENPLVEYQKVNSTDVVTLKFEQLSDNNRRFCLDGSILLVPPTGELTITCQGSHRHGWDLMVKS